jgi:hypothetical protein
MSPAADVLPEALHSVDGKQFFEFAQKSHEETMQRTALHSRNDGLGSCRIWRSFVTSAAAEGQVTNLPHIKHQTAGMPSFLDFYPSETGRTFMDGESVVPAGAWDELLPVKVLLVTPNHIQGRA